MPVCLPSKQGNVKGFSQCCENTLSKAVVFCEFCQAVLFSRQLFGICRLPYGIFLAGETGQAFGDVKV